MLANRTVVTLAGKAGHQSGPGSLRWYQLRELLDGHAMGIGEALQLLILLRHEAFSHNAAANVDVSPGPLMGHARLRSHRTRGRYCCVSGNPQKSFIPLYSL